MSRMMACCVLLVACCCARGNLTEALQHAQWRVRDVAANSEFVPADHVDSLKLKLESVAPKTDPVWTSWCTVIDTTGADRAVTLALCIPLDAAGAQWWDDLQTARPIQGSDLLSNLADMAGGVDASASRYPMSVVSQGDDALCVAVPIVPASLPRFVYDPIHKELRAEFDFGLSKIPQAFPSRADATVIAYPVPGKLAFRQALAKYYALYPAAFERKTKTAGIWLPFNDMQTIEHPEDFGFGFHEYGGKPSDDLDAAKKTIAADHAVGCRTYIYVEPPTYWQTFKGQGKGNFDQRLAQLKDEAAHGVKVAQATLNTGLIRADGKRDLYLDPVPYTMEAPWGNDADPHLPDDPITHWPTKAHYEFDRLETALGWRDQPSVGLDGVYIDSMEGWGEILNYNTDHWKYSQHPLTFDAKNHNKVALLNFWGTYDFIKEMRDRLHAHNELLMGNDAYFRRWCLAPWVDVPGREYTWIEKGKFVPLPDERYLFFRAMSYQRPYLMLMNNPFADASAIEPYFQRNLFYAVYPGFFTANTAMGERPYFDHAEWYNRDRPLFKKYIPLIKKLDEAGWQPLPGATASSDAIRFERYGSWEKGDLAFTVHNTSDQKIDATLNLSRAELGIAGDATASEWIAALPVSTTADDATITLKFSLNANGYGAVGLQR